MHRVHGIDCSKVCFSMQRRYSHHTKTKLLYTPEHNAECIYDDAGIGVILIVLLITGGCSFSVSIFSPFR